MRLASMIAGTLFINVLCNVNYCRVTSTLVRRAQAGVCVVIRTDVMDSAPHVT